MRYRFQETFQKNSTRGFHRTTAMLSCFDTVIKSPVKLAVFTGSIPPLCLFQNKNSCLHHVKQYRSMNTVEPSLSVRPPSVSDHLAKRTKFSESKLFNKNLS